MKELEIDLKSETIQKQRVQINFFCMQLQRELILDIQNSEAFVPYFTLLEN